MKDIVLLGATGYVGRALLNEALDRGEKVTAIVRNADKLKDIENPNLTVVTGDITDPDVIEKYAKGKDAIISAYNPGWTNPNIAEDTLKNYPRILEGAKKAGVPRLLIVGGGGSLFVAPGVRLYDTEGFPEAWLPGSKSLGEFYLNTLTKENDIDWIFLSPAANLGNLEYGKRTGKYRVGKDDLLVDENGDSFISVEDFAVAMIDELETPKHHKERFTVAY